MLSKHIKSHSLSILLHLSILLCTINFVHQNSEIISEKLKIPKHIDISLDLLKNAKMGKKHGNKTSENVIPKDYENTAPTMLTSASTKQNQEQDSIKNNKSNQGVEQASKDNDKNQKNEIKINYTQILSKHFAAAMTDNDIFEEIKQIYLIIKVNGNGDIIAYDFKPAINNKIEEFLTELINNATPVPMPPKELININSYVVPIFVD